MVFLPKREPRSLGCAKGTHSLLAQRALCDTVAHRCDRDCVRGAGHVSGRWRCRQTEARVSSIAMQDRGWAVLGAGTMAETIIAGQRSVAPSSESLGFHLYDPRAERLEELRQRYGATPHPSANAAVQSASRVLLCVKPQQVKAAMEPLGNGAAGRLLVSVAAGVSSARLRRLLPKDARVIRAMPNTPCLVGAGAVAIAPGPGHLPEDLAAAHALFAPLGRIWTLGEEHLDAVTGLSGSGPAYVLGFVEALSAAAVAEGLPAALAQEMACQTIAGTIALLRERKLHPAQLRDEVTSPAGTTARGLAALEAQGFRHAVAEAVRAATLRSRELAEDV